MSAPPFAWTSGEIHADVVLLVGIVALIYAVAWRRGPRATLRRPALFMAALLVLLGALNGPLHDLSDYYLFSAHMVQHLLLTLVVLPLLLAGTPRWMADALVRCLERVRVLGALGRAATRPVPALTLYAAALIGWHLPGPYQAAVRKKAGRIAAAGMTKEVTFEPVEGRIHDRIDDAYWAKYKGSPYLSPMVGERAHSATVKVA